MRIGRRLGIVVVAAAVSVSACSQAEQADSEQTDVGTEAAGTATVGTETAGAPSGAVRRDLGLELRAEVDVPTNLLPSVAVHDVGQDRMVDFRNIFPAERPVLLWMWAPY